MVNKKYENVRHYNTFKLVKDSPELSNVCSKGNICIKYNDSFEVGRQSLCQNQLHQPIYPRIVFVGYPGHFRLIDRKDKEERRKERKRQALLEIVVLIKNRFLSILPNACP